MQIRSCHLPSGNILYQLAGRLSWRRRKKLVIQKLADGSGQDSQAAHLSCKGQASFSLVFTFLCVFIFPKVRVGSLAYMHSPLGQGKEKQGMCTIILRAKPRNCKYYFSLHLIDKSFYYIIRIEWKMSLLIRWSWTVSNSKYPRPKTIDVAKKEGLVVTSVLLSTIHTCKVISKVLCDLTSPFPSLPSL